MSDHAPRPPLRSTFISLRIRNYRLYFFGQLVSFDVVERPLRIGAGTGRLEHYTRQFELSR